MLVTDVESYYQNLSLESKNKLFRVSIEDREFSQAASCLEESFASLKGKYGSEDVQQISSIKEILRFLRNACISCERNQNIIRNSNAVSVTLDLIHTTLERENAIQKDLQIGCFQFLGNFVTGNTSCQEVVWSKIVPKFAIHFLERLESSVKDLFCMVIFNCIRQRPNFIEENKAVEVMLLIIDHCKEENSEWGLFIMEFVVSSGCFVNLYEKIADFQNQRIVLLEILLAFLEDEALAIPEETILFIADLFELSCQLLNGERNASHDEEQKTAEFIVIYLKIICSSTVYRDRYEKLLHRTELLQQTINLLKTLSKNSLREVDKSECLETKEKMSLCFLKKHLVRIIGNMCYDVKENQNKVRELDGIAAILNNCRIDEENPYIMQWASFTIRNLCEDNLENQRLISSLERQGLVDNKLLRAQGIDARLENGRIRIRT